MRSFFCEKNNRDCTIIRNTRVVSLFSKMERQGVKNLKKLMTSFMNGPLVQLRSLHSVEHRGHPYTTWSVKGGGGVDEMTMNDHEGGGEGSRNDHVVTWTEMCFESDQKNDCVNSQFGL